MRLARTDANQRAQPHARRGATPGWGKCVDIVNFVNFTRVASVAKRPQRVRLGLTFA
jgi:hypothetical protein